MAEIKQKKDVVNFSVRFDPELFEQLESYLNAIPRRDRPSKDAVIQLAVRNLIESGLAGNETGAESAEHLPALKVYPSDLSPGDVHLSPQMLEKLRGIIKELQEFHGQLVIPAADATTAGGGSTDEQSATERHAALLREGAEAIRDAEVALATAERTRESAKRDPKHHVKPGK